MKKATVIGLVIGIGVLVGAGYLFVRSRDAAPGGPATSAAAASGAASGAGGAPVSVSSVRAQQREVDVVLEATGTVTALNSVDVRPQVSSTIMKVHIREGQFVKQGQLLFTLDARNDEVNLTKAKAQLAKDMASLADAQRQLARSRDLFAQNFISQGAVDTNQTLVEAQQAVVASDRAAIEAAQVGLSYTRIVAPSAGRAGAINVFAGSSVQPTGAVLVTITQLDPIAVGFNLPQRNLGDALQTLRGGGGKVSAVLPEGRGTLTGRLRFVDNAVDAGSGTVRVKAEFPNADEKLWPGAFVNVRLAVQTLKDAVVLPQAAIITAPRGRIVYVVDVSNKASPRPVEIVYPFGEEAVVSGVKSGERVVVDGRQNLRSGSTVVERAPSEGGGRSRRGAGAASAASTPSGPATEAVPASAPAAAAAPLAMSSGATP
jgi:RND family efflux transporter MFP subunit